MLKTLAQYAACMLVIGNVHFVNAQAQQMAMPSPPGSLSRPGHEPIYSMTLGKGRIEEMEASAEARQFLERGRYEEAEHAYRKVLTEIESRRDARSAASQSDIARTMANLGLLFHVQGRYEEAARFYRASIDITRKQWEVSGGSAALREKLTERENVLKYSQLANVLYAQGHSDEAEALHTKVLLILGTTTKEERAELEQAQAKSTGAGDIYIKKLRYELLTAELNEGLGANNVAQFYLSKGEYPRATALYQKALDIFIRVRGTTDHSDVALTYNNLALVAQAQGQYREAQLFLLKSYQSFQNARGAEHPDAVVVLRNLAALYTGQHDWEKALESYDKAARVVVNRMEHRLNPGNASPLTTARNEIDWNKSLFDGLVVAAMQVSESKPDQQSYLTERAYEAGQWSGQALAGAALLQMAVRQSNRDPTLASIVRKRQDRIGESEKLEAQLISSISGAPEMRDEAMEEENRQRLDNIDQEISEIDARLSREFPEYFALVGPGSISLATTQEFLQENEALLKFQLTASDGFVWLVTRKTIKWIKLSLNAGAIAEQVMALRCGLDYDGTWAPFGSRCSELLKTSYTETDHEDGKPLPFDRARAHALYKALFGQIEDQIKDKHLLIVPSGALTQLPFQVLITEKSETPASEDGAFRRAAWLVREHALTVLPSVSSLKALRQLAKSSHAGRAMIGFGNPLLTGPDARYGKWARAARSKQSCPKTTEQRAAALMGERRGVLPLELRRGLADVSQIRMQAPLPETADELCTVARELHVNSDEIRLGARATEAEVRRLSEAGELAKYRIIHFATHGALAGQVSGNSESGLLLTPPNIATEADDGYLSASEIAALKLDADWIILSACNTAAGGAEGAEALSGLARAFFYAGARALLVSHWAVYSDATVKLITGAVGRIAADKSVGRGEALRQSMLALINRGKTSEAHPSYWAPFVVVGEGATAK